LIYLLDRDGRLNNTAIAGLLDGLHSSGIGRIILKVSKQIASGKYAKIEVKEIAEFYAQKNKIVNSQLKV
jgi:methylmalonyl-CoA mutase cobalamin-binding subunit